MKEKPRAELYPSRPGNKRGLIWQQVLEIQVLSHRVLMHFTLGSKTAITGNPKAHFMDTCFIQTTHQGCALAEPGGPLRLTFALG